MKLIFEAKKPFRYKRYFMGVCQDFDSEGYNLWFNHETRRWQQYDGISRCGTYAYIKTLKAFKRHIRKHSFYLKAGVVLRLCNKYVGQDVIYKVK